MNRKQILITVLISLTLLSGIYAFAKLRRKSGVFTLFGLGSKPSQDLTSLKRDVFPLMKGITSREVAIYQTHLNEKSGASLAIDGNWGSLTESASKKTYGWSTVDSATYQVNFKPKEATLIRLARESQNVIIAS